MKEYPSIAGSTGQAFVDLGDAYVFDKLDGSNLRFEVALKKGLVKQGTRRRLFDLSDPVFAEAIAVFNSTLLESVQKLIKDNRWERTIVFTEFWGENSFAGLHEASDKKHLSIFDINPYKKGILGPREFLKLTEKELPFPLTAKFLGRHHWTRGFVEKVWYGQLPDVTLEGVVGKIGEGHSLQMAKAKTKSWVDKVHEKLSPEAAEELLNS